MMWNWTVYQVSKRYHLIFYEFNFVTIHYIQIFDKSLGSL